jgi:hypothetical protein
MKRALLIVRLIVEAVIGTMCIADVFLLPGIWKERDHVSYAMGQLFGVLIFILIGVLCIKDVVKIRRALKASRSNPSLISEWPITSSPPDVRQLEERSSIRVDAKN